VALRLTTDQAGRKLDAGVVRLLQEPTIALAMSALASGLEPLCNLMLTLSDKEGRRQ
jgi:hypothetical protein